VLFGYLKNVCPDMSLNKDKEDENLFKRPSVLGQPKPKLISDMQIGFPLFSPNNPKPNVGGLCLVCSGVGI